MKLTKEQRARSESPGEWGRYGSVDMARYSKPITGRGGRRKCPAPDCVKKVSHLGMANGLALCSYCEWHVNQWIVGGYDAIYGGPL